MSDDLQRFDEWRRVHQAHGELTHGGLGKDSCATVTCSCGDSKVIRFTVTPSAEVAWVVVPENTRTL